MCDGSFADDGATRGVSRTVFKCVTAWVMSVDDDILVFRLGFIGSLSGFSRAVAQAGHWEKRDPRRTSVTSASNDITPHHRKVRCHFVVAVYRLRVKPNREANAEIKLDL